MSAFAAIFINHQIKKKYVKLIIKDKKRILQEF